MHSSTSYILPLLYEENVKEFNEKLKEIKDPSVIYVSDLVVCTHKWYLRRKYPELTFRFEPQLMIGRVVHEGLARFLEKKGFEIELSIEREVYVDSRKYLLKGRVDAYNRDEKIIIEFKYSKLFKEKPLEHHIMQLQIYMNMLDAEKGVLMYLTPNAMVEFQYDRMDYSIDKQVKDVVEDCHRPRWSWECRFCVFRRLCGYATSSLYSR